MTVIVKLWISIIVGDEKLVNFQDKGREIRLTVRNIGDKDNFDLMQSEILESLEDKHFTYVVHIK